MMYNMRSKSLQNHIDKSSTQQDKFLKNFPEFDGRGVVIAVIDRCLDVSLPGLQQTTTLPHKIINCYDFTGNGNVDTSMVKKTSKNDILIGLTGRKLKIPSTWKNPSGKWHLGIKSIYELFDEEALELIAKMRKNAISEENKILKEKLLLSTMSDDDDDNKMMLEYLDSTEKLSEDSLVADCVVWFNGEKWETCLDTSFKGSLEESKVLASFRDSHDYGLIFGKIAYCTTIHDEGNLLEIYVNFGIHGTLMANIAAAYFPGDSERDGLAPGAQIICMSVLDPRNNGYLNKNATIKAFKKCLELGVDIINYSISGFPKEVYPIMKELTEKHGTLIIKAAGNEGPICSSIPDLEPRVSGMIFQIGSLISSDTKSILSGSNEKDATAVSAFSSRGPMASGSRGVSFIAPGHGATSNPRHFPDEQYSFGATSCSAPNAAGAIACLISGLKNTHIPYSPYTLRLALTNTAMHIEEVDPLAYGDGIIQIEKAFEYLQKSNFQNNVSKTIINVTFLLEKAKTTNVYKEKSIEIDGIFLKMNNEKDLSGVYDFSVKIVVNYYNLLNDTVDISWLLKISSDAKTFIELSENIQNNTFFIQINASLFKFNSINYCEIHGFDSANLSLGPLFKFPITIIVPKFINKNDKIKNVFTLNNSRNIHRFFFCPPPESCHCLIKTCCLVEEEISTTLQFHYFDRSETVEFTPEDKERKGCFLLKNEEERLDTLEQIFGKRCEGKCHEICYYLTLGNSGKFQYELQFVGLEKLNSFNYLNPLQAFGKTQGVRFRNRGLYAAPVTDVMIEFNKIKFEITAEKIKFRKIYKKHYFILTYSFKVLHKTSCKIRTTYYGDELEPYDLERIQIFTASKKFISGFSSSNKKIPFNAGNYIVKALFEYDDSHFLQKFLPFLIRFPILVVKQYFDEPLKPALQNLEKGITKVIMEKEILQLYYNSISTTNVSTSSSVMPLFSTLKGIVKIEIENMDVYFSLKQRYGNFGKEFIEFRIIREYFQSFLPYSTEITKMLCNISPEEILKWQKTLRDIYLKQNKEKFLMETVEAFLKAVNYKYFFKIYDKIKVASNAYENRLLETRKDAIIEGLFIRADSMLNKCLKNFHFPKTFYYKLGHKFLFLKNENGTSKCNIVVNLLALLTYDIYPKEIGNSNFNKPKQPFPEFSSDQTNNKKRETIKKAVPENQKVVKNWMKNCNIAAADKENAKNACEDLFQRIENSDIRRDFIIFKKAALFGSFGTALFHLNKLSTENFSNPDFQIFDEAIIEILNNLGWKHLVEAQENSLLDKHRHYYRPF